MAITRKLGRVFLCIFFFGLAINQLQNPQQAITQTHDKTVEFLIWMKHITQSPYVITEMSYEMTAFSVVACCLLKILVAIGIIFNSKYSRLFGSSYIVMAIFVLNNPFKGEGKGSLLMMGALGAMQFIG